MAVQDAYLKWLQQRLGAMPMPKVQPIGEGTVGATHSYGADRSSAVDWEAKARRVALEIANQYKQLMFGINPPLPREKASQGKPVQEWTDTDKWNLHDACGGVIADMCRLLMDLSPEYRAYALKAVNDTFDGQKLG